MTAPVAVPDDLASYLGVADIDTARATLILGMAQTCCEAVVSPLPTGAEAVVLDVAARAYLNAANVQQQGTGPYSVSYGAVSGGLWLTQQNRATLRALAGGGGAFSIDVLSATAGTGLPYWDSYDPVYGVAPGTTQ